MVLTPSTMLELGTPLPHFTLPDTHSNMDLVSSESFASNLVLVGFICNHCPYVLHLADVLAAHLSKIDAQKISVLMVSSNDAESYPQDGPEQMTAFAQQYKFNFPYLYDESQKVAQSFKAACTPEFYLFDKERKLIYRGQFDASRPGSKVEVTGADLLEAIRLGIEGKVKNNQTPSVGCNIKWKPGV